MVSLVDRDSHSRPIFEGVPDSFEVARYHSLYGARDKMPDVLRATAQTADGVVRTRTPCSCCCFYKGRL